MKKWILDDLEQTLEAWHRLSYTMIADEAVTTASSQFALENIIWMSSYLRSVQSTLENAREVPNDEILESLVSRVWDGYEEGDPGSEVTRCGRLTVLSRLVLCPAKRDNPLILKDGAEAQ